jgi:hypothetical protein
MKASRVPTVNVSFGPAQTLENDSCSLYLSSLSPFSMTLDSVEP